MTTITIPKKVTGKEELVILPRKEFDRLIRAIKKAEAFKNLDADLKQALKEVAAGRTFGPFDNVKDLMKSLKN